MELQHAEESFLSVAAPTQVTVYNIPHEMGEQDVRDVFGQFGSILSIKITKMHAYSVNAARIVYEQYLEANVAVNCASGQYIAQNKIYVSQEGRETAELTRFLCTCLPLGCSPLRRCYTPCDLFEEEDSQ